MVEHKFNNKYEVILPTVSLLLDRFETEDQLFAAHSVQWLASILQFTEILIYYQQYKIFPSNYISNCEMPPLPIWAPEGTMIPEWDISTMTVDENLDSAVYTSWKK